MAKIGYTTDDGCTTLSDLPPSAVNLCRILILLDVGSHLLMERIHKLTLELTKTAS